MEEEALNDSVSTHIWKAKCQEMMNMGNRYVCAVSDYRTSLSFVANFIQINILCWHEIGPVLARTGPMSCQHRLF